MVPVSLRLENFLSYGKALDPLPFDQFQVACLSGGNGQGKSALLDAITWVLWGQARKPQGQGTPDEHLLRIGEKRMFVEFVFDVEGARYRVHRGFARSASGKTPKPSLEVQILDPAVGEYRALTGASKRDTQHILNSLLGIDYETFINASFLLQGRSDEFTKRPASERKKILSNILNLERYEVLKEKAQERVRLAKTSLEVADHRIKALEDGLRDLAAWEAQFLHLQQTFTSTSTHLSRLETELEALNHTLTLLSTKAADLTAERQRLSTYLQQIQAYTSRKQQLKQDLTNAEQLLAHSAEIHTNFKKHDELSKARLALDDTQNILRSFEEQVSQTERLRDEKRHRVERFLEALRTDLIHLRSAYNKGMAALGALPQIRERWQQVLTEKNQFEALQKQKTQQLTLSQKRESLEKEIAQNNAALTAQIQQLETQIAQADHDLADLEQARKQAQQAQEALEAKKQQEAALQEAKLTGQERKAEWLALKQELDHLQKQLEEIYQNMRLVQEAQSETCPTCGTALTESHRSHMAVYYQAQAAPLEAQKDAVRLQFNLKHQEVMQCATQYRAIEVDLHQIRDTEKRVQEAEQRVASLLQTQAQVQIWRTQCTTLKSDLAQGSRITVPQSQLQTILAALDVLRVDEVLFNALSKKPTEFALLDQQVKELEKSKTEIANLDIDIQLKASQEAKQRQTLLEGKETAQEEARIKDLKEKIARLGYNAAAHQEVKTALNKLSHAPAQFAALLNAKDNVARWQQDLAALGTDLARCEEAKAQSETKIAALVEALAEKPMLEAAQARLRSDRDATKAQAQTLQQASLRLEQRIAQAKADQATIRKIQQENQQAIQTRDLYSHLTKAFGQDGIPAIIIEETLPELEDRANRLLYRLTEGRMTLRLETVKNTKSGASKGTLDLIINDELGMPRPYETYSGGEAFRVNFALRIALSQLLAERNGVSIQTLVIDEGFGTQDQTGIKHMIDAINTIRDDFEKIIVITHLDELKNAFPTRIEVNKEPEGSQYRVFSE